MLIHGDNCAPMREAVQQAHIVKDIKLDEVLYGHISNFGIEKRVDDDSCDTGGAYNILIIDSKDPETTKIALEERMERINTCIIIKRNGNDYDFSYRDWVVEDEGESVILTYQKRELFMNNHDDLLSYYELMYYVNKYLEENSIKYFAIKSSCLGCVRNRSHIVFCDTIHICVIDKLGGELPPDIGHNIRLNRCTVYDEFVLEKDVVSEHNRTKKVSVRLHFGKISDDRMLIENEEPILLREVGVSPFYNYGPIRIRSLERPNKYLQRSYGPKVFHQLVHEGLTVTMPKMVYDCYYNQWSAYTSDSWKRRQILHLHDVYSCLIRNGIYCWIDCGTLLGSARNSFVCLFDDDNDIGIFEADLGKAYEALDRDRISRSVPIKYVNSDFSLREFYDLKTSYNGKENLNYTFSENIDLLTEFRAYNLHEDRYVSMKDDRVSKAHGVPGLLSKRATDRRHFDNITNKIKLGRYHFMCPNDHIGYLESASRYGKGSIEGNPIRDCKPGNIVLYDDF